MKLFNVLLLCLYLPHCSQETHFIRLSIQFLCTHILSFLVDFSLFYFL
jgi:hypothetical protein